MVCLDSMYKITVPHGTYSTSNTRWLDDSVLLEDLSNLSIRFRSEVALVELMHSDKTILPSRSVRSARRMYSDSILW